MGGYEPAWIELELARVALRESSRPRSPLLLGWEPSFDEVVQGVR